jgi:flagellar biosynthesis/type III secretory pathway chaperone
MASIKKEVIKELDAIFEKHKKKHPNRKISDKELEQLLVSELTPELVRKILHVRKRNYKNKDDLKKEIEKLKDQNEFLRSLVRSFEDIKAGRISEFK